MAYNVADRAEEAYHVELDVLNEPIGEQDQYVAAHGKIPCFEFNHGQRVNGATEGSARVWQGRGRTCRCRRRAVFLWR